MPIMQASRSTFFCATMFLLTAHPLGAQSGTAVSGRVLSAKDSTPIVGAEVRAAHGAAHGAVLARTNTRGEFALSPSANSSVTIRALGFRSDSGVTLRGAATLYLTPLATTLTSVVTTAGQRTIRAAEATSSVSIVEREQIDAAAAIAVNQVLRNLPGLQEIPSPPSQTSIAIRGLDAERVLILVDGEPASGALIDNRDIGRLSTVAVKRVEVTKGPSSVEFGSDALGGVINVVTAAPSEQLTFDGVFRSGALGRMESNVGVSETIGAFGFRVDGGWRQVDRVTGYDAEGSALNRVYDVRADSRYRLAEHSSLRVNAQGTRERQRWPVGGGFNGFVDNRSLQGLAEYTRDVGGGALKLRGFAQDYFYQYRQARGDIPIAGSADSLEQRERLRRALLSYARSFGAHQVDVGAQFSHRFIRSPGKVERDSAQDDVIEVFARDAMRFKSVLTTLGVRSTNSSLWGASVNPSVGAAWESASRWRVRGSVARGFRAPSFKEMRYTFLNASGGYTVVGNANLKPESSWSTSGALTFAPAASTTIELEGFRNALENLIDTRLSGTNPAGYLRYQNVNVASAITQGIEASVRSNIALVETTVGYTYLDTRDNENNLPLSRRSKHTARATFARQWRLLAGLTTDASVRYQSKAPVVGSNAAGSPAIITHQGEFLSVDGQLRVSLTHGSELSVGVNNLLNKQPTMFTPAYARQVFMGLSLHWQP